MKEEFIELKSLLDELTKGNVVPVIGNDLSLVKGDEKREIISLYEYIAGRITKQDISISIHELTLTPHASNIVNLENKIQSVYDDIKEKQKFYLKPLEYLAKITDFKFYISTAIDDLLEEAIRKERKYTDEQMEIINYSYIDRSTNPQDGPAEKKGEPKVTIFKLMGTLKGYVAPAIDEEKMLEHLISICSRENETHQQIRDFIEKVTGKTFLFIGCDFPDWLMRFFIRISTNRRLIGQKSVDYVVNKSARQLGNSDEQLPKLKIFLTHCGKEFVTTKVSNLEDAIAFEEQLYLEWLERKKEKTPFRYEKLVFLSYHGNDVIYAQKLKNKLEAEGIRVWFDQTDLKDGEHETNIRKIIAKECSVFLPLISGDVLKDPNSYARRVEWKMSENVYEAKKFADNEEFYLFPCITDITDRSNEQIPEFLRKVKIYILKDEEEKIIDDIKDKFKSSDMEQNAAK